MCEKHLYKNVKMMKNSDYFFRLIERFYAIIVRHTKYWARICESKQITKNVKTFLLTSIEMRGIIHARCKNVFTTWRVVSWKKGDKMRKKPRILVVGSFMMDLIASTGRAPNSGETVVGLKFQTAPGGKGANQAVQCARLGAQVTMVGKVGDDSFGRIMTKAVAASGVDISHVLVDKNESSGVGHITLEITEHGAQNRITVCPGANFTLTLDDVAWLEKAISNFDLVMMQFEIPMGIVETVAQWAKDAGVIVMINPAPAVPMSDKLLLCTTYLSPNEHEAAILAGHTINVDHGVDFKDIELVAREFQNRGTENLIITLGENGAVVAGKDGIHHTPCVRMPHVADPTAAGDSFVAAFCTGLTAGLPSEEALVFASHAAAITVSHMGAMPSLPTLLEVQALLKERSYKGFDSSVLDILKQGEI